MYNSAKQPCIEWHDLRMAPYDLPMDQEQIITTTESFDGSRRTHTDIYLKSIDDYHFFWCLKYFDKESSMFKETVFWEEVIAWSYLPDPYTIEREKLY